MKFQKIRIKMRMLTLLIRPGLALFVGIDLVSVVVHFINTINVVNIPFIPFIPARG